jgi:hypothetical protein
MPKIPVHDSRRLRVNMFDVRGHGMSDKLLGSYSKFVFSIA